MAGRLPSGYRDGGRQSRTSIDTETKWGEHAGRKADGEADREEATQAAGERYKLPPSPACPLGFLNLSVQIE